MSTIDSFEIFRQSFSPQTGERLATAIETDARMRTELRPPRGASFFRIFAALGRLRNVVTGAGEQGRDLYLPDQRSGLALLADAADAAKLAVAKSVTTEPVSPQLAELSAVLETHESDAMAAVRGEVPFERPVYVPPADPADQITFAPRA